MNEFELDLFKEVYMKVGFVSLGCSKNLIDTEMRNRGS